MFLIFNLKFFYRILLSMHLRPRETLLISAFLISLSIVISSTLAAVVEVSLMPVQTAPDKAIEFSLSLKNLGGDNVNKVELVVPQEDSVPLYLIKEIGNPAGWTYESRYSVGAPAPFRIIWSTADSGISSSKSLNFNFVAKSPKSGGDFNFEWKAVDLNSNEDFGKVKVTNFNPVLSNFEVKASNSTAAGKEFEFAVAALDQNGNKKPDYIGTVKFSSSDSLAILPEDYKFQLVDNGVKVFKIKLKTLGEQEVKISDGSVEKSVKVNVQQNDVNSVELKLSNDTAMPNTLITLNVWSTDVYGNMKDVTKDSKFEIDKEAKGKLENSTYTTEAIGKWTVIATYTMNSKKFYDGALLTVTAELPKPKEVKAPEPEKKVSMEIVSDDLVEVPFNSTKLFSITVKNTGDVDIANVSMYFSGFPEKWMSIAPNIADISKGKSQRFTVTVSAPERVEPSNVEFLALSSGYPSEKLNASKTIKINVTEPTPTPEEKVTGAGKVVLSKNLTYLGIAIVVAVVLIILFWALFLKEEPKKKKEE